MFKFREFNCDKSVTTVVTTIIDARYCVEKDESMTLFITSALGREYWFDFIDKAYLDEVLDDIATENYSSFNAKNLLGYNFEELGNDIEADMENQKDKPLIMQQPLEDTLGLARKLSIGGNKKDVSIY